jgi:hypothetical protein
MIILPIWHHVETASEPAEQTIVRHAPERQRSNGRHSLAHCLATTTKHSSHYIQHPASASKSTEMKASRLIVYGITGVIAGLLFENGALRLRAKGGQKIREAKKKAEKKLDELRSGN